MPKWVEFRQENDVNNVKQPLVLDADEICGWEPYNQGTYLFLRGGSSAMTFDAWADVDAKLRRRRKKSSKP